MVLRNISVSVVLLIWIIIGQVSAVLAVITGGVVLDIFSLVYHFSLGGGRVVRWCWVNFQCRGVLQF